MRTLIAGLGSIGRRHLRNLAALGERDIILYRSGKSTLPDEELKDYPAETELKAALAHEPDAVIIANPTSLHFDVAIPAARQGCTLYLEKPISDSLDRVDELRDAVRIGGGKVLIGFQFRFHPGLQQIKRLLTENAIGKVISGRAHWGEYLPDWHPWEDYRKSYAARTDLGGGVVLTLCHPFDYLMWLLGNVKTLNARLGRLSDLEMEVEDTAEVLLQFANGALGSVHLDYCQRPPVHRMELIGTHGSIRWDNTDGTVNLFRSSDNTWETFPAPEGFERNQMFVNEMRHLIAIVKGDEQPVCSLEDGIRVLQLTTAIYDSSRKNGMSVNF
jgi:predicted dehydrogenase